MKNLKISIVLILAAFGFVSCNSDDNGDSYTYVPTSQSFRALFDDALESRIQTATFDAETTLYFTSEKGVLLTIYGNCLRKNGNPVTGNVDLEFVEILDRASMLVTNKPTMGVENGETKLLTSGGEFYINVTQDGVELTLDCGMMLSAPTSLTGGTDNAMLPFAGTIDQDGDLIWEQTVTGEFWIGQAQAAGSENYNVLYNSFGWFNYDRFVDYTGPRTAISFMVPQGYGNDNSMVFMTTNDFPNSLGTTYGEFPVGLNVNFIFVTEENGLFRYAIKPTEALVPNHQVTFSLSETTLGTEAQLIAAINAL